ncbi:MAG: hypothetical protein SFU25_02005 [Candidatus Caenarcaniphilales bacterium]|nr:hypothetical protein [Candidatus Caenarcaniphilales bacterium]
MKAKSLIQKSFFLFLLTICILLNLSTARSQELDYEKINKEVEEKIKSENNKIDQEVTLKPKVTSNLIKYTNYSKTEDPYGNEDQIGVVEYINKQNGDSMKLVSDSLVNKFGNSNHQKCSAAFKEILENTSRDLNELDSSKYLCMLNEGSELTIGSIDAKKVLSNLKIAYTIVHPSFQHLSVRVIFIKDKHFIQLKKDLKISKLQNIFQESKLDDEFNYHRYMDKIKEDDSLQKIIESSAKELIQEFAL